MSDDVNGMLFEALIQGKDDSALVPAAAAAGGIAARTVYDYCSDRRKTPSVHAVRGAFAVTEHPGLRAVLTPPGWELVRKAELIRPQTNNLCRELEDVFIEAGGLLRDFRTIVDRAKMGEEQDQQIIRSASRGLSRLKRELAEVDQLFFDMIQEG